MGLSKNQWMYIGGFVLIAVICIATLTFVSGDFGGSDDSGGSTAEDDYGYIPWTDDLFTLLGFEMPGETESLLFAVQAGIGAFIIGYFVGQSSGKKKALAATAAAAEPAAAEAAPADEPVAEEPAAEADESAEAEAKAEE